jgi:hypothetical protein
MGTQRLCQWQSRIGLTAQAEIIQAKSQCSAIARDARSRRGL